MLLCLNTFNTYHHQYHIQYLSPWRHLLLLFLSPQRVLSAHLGYFQSWKLWLWEMWLLYAPSHHPVYTTGCQYPSCAFEKTNQILCTDLSQNVKNFGCLCPQGFSVCMCRTGLAGIAPNSSEPSTQKQCCSPALTSQLMLCYHKMFICSGWCLILSMDRSDKVL